MLILVKKNINKLKKGKIYKPIKECPFEYVLKEGYCLEYISKEAPGTETENFIFINEPLYEKAMYILLNKKNNITKNHCVDLSVNLIFDYIFKNFLKPNNINDIKLENFYKNKNIIISYMDEDTILNLKEQEPELILIRDMGLTHLKENTLTCATKGIIDGTFEIIINSNINLKKGKLIGQVGHAMCSYLYYNYMLTLPFEQIKEFQEYMFAQKKITLNCSDEELEEIKEKYNPITYSKYNELTLNIGIINRNPNSEIFKKISTFKLY